MTQHNSLNVELSNSQLNKLKSAIKNKTEVFLTFKQPGGQFDRPLWFFQKYIF